MSVKFFNPRGEIEKTEHRLPHWQQDEVPVFVTFRLADSLPREVVDTWHTEREMFFINHPQPWDEITEACFHGLFSNKLDEALDAGHGSAVLRLPPIAQIVQARLHHFDNQRYRLQSYVIMPNHVHVLFSMEVAESLPAILQGWKGVSSRFIHKNGLCDLNPFWQPEYFDRLIRSPEHLETVSAYIRENPAKAGLKSGFILWERS
ncbi:type I restriction enzyme R subunit/putative DNA methylase [Prosthecobacter fusiformis]|uniref:Type I restriction enzyme R subunit/putative DNA methylase n=1 Tax=Prosthecobacter fusiformis TaxID=48464 RepID=A0A4R7RN30_9BACT|nr:transposase [Prosthecobacter fusiformis]TDU66198.1 type I restriction enzyme R subunit/putative DNA methylase [Prosthecobacter fusiformis]